jgi:ribosomal-protein-alanine N-acetyltransferase
VAETTGVIIDRLKNDQQARACARLMASSEPWITLGRDEESALRNLRNPDVEVSVAADGAMVLGFIILSMRGPFRGYIQTVGVVPQHRGRGIGTRLVRFAEERIFRETPNVFLCVSSFNNRAQNLYRRLGYEVVGQLKNFIVPGHSEILMRKTIGPLVSFRRPATQRDEEKKKG